MKLVRGGLGELRDLDACIDTFLQELQLELGFEALNQQKSMETTVSRLMEMVASLGGEKVCSPCSATGSGPCVLPGPVVTS